MIEPLRALYVPIGFTTDPQSSRSSPYCYVRCMYRLASQPTLGRPGHPRTVTCVVCTDWLHNRPSVVPVIPVLLRALHVQIGFTTDPRSSRSSPYCYVHCMYRLASQPTLGRPSHPRTVTCVACTDWLHNRPSVVPVVAVLYGRCKSR